MFKRVDLEQESELLEGFSYLNDSGDAEFVRLQSTDHILVEDSFGASVSIYYTDIPKLVKALEAAYKYNKENK